tara:strand:- start:146 stop:775 length:630 start_codon:yes stop_codon:yes gene_type:complete
MIIPALLTEDIEKLNSMIQLCSVFTDYVQIDIMDGEFVPSKSISLSDLKNLKSSIRSEAHLMVTDPLEWLDAFKEIGSERIIYHYEIDKDHSQIISQIKAKGFKVGIAVNPETKISEFSNLLPQIDTVLFLSVNPGFYGATFIPEVLDKMKDFKGAYPEKNIGIDGGMKLTNVANARKAGADYICVGSAILKSDNPQQAYENLLKVING